MEPLCYVDFKCGRRYTDDAEGSNLPPKKIVFNSNVVHVYGKRWNMEPTLLSWIKKYCLNKDNSKTDAGFIFLRYIVSSKQFKTLIFESII